MRPAYKIVILLIVLISATLIYDFVHPREPFVKLSEQYIDETYPLQPHGYMDQTEIIHPVADEDMMVVRGYLERVDYSYNQGDDQIAYSVTFNNMKEDGRNMTISGIVFADQSNNVNMPKHLSDGPAELTFMRRFMTSGADIPGEYILVRSKVIGVELNQSEMFNLQDRISSADNSSENGSYHELISIRNV
jgi:hypothetical protein